MNRRRIGLFAPLAFALLACSSEDPAPLRTVSQNLTPAQSRVLGFETPTSDWSPGNGSSVSSSSDVTQGAASLRIVINGYTQLASTNIPAPGSARPQATFDLKLGSQIGWGEARLVAVIPSQGKYWSDLGGVPLAGLPAGTFRNISFNVPADVQAALNGTATDVSFRVILNAPSGTTFTLDNLEVSDEGSGDPGEATTDTVEFSVAVPAGTPISSVVLSGTNKVTVDDRSTISKLGAGSKIASLGSGRLELGAGVKAYADVISVGDVDFLRSQSHVYGQVTTAGTVQQQDNVIVDGGITTGANVSPVVTSWTVEWPSGPASDVSIPPDTPTTRLEPGTYDSVKVFSRSGIILESGSYFINTLEIEPQVQFLADVSRGPVQIYVRDMVVLRSRLLYFGGQAGQVLIGYIGQQTALFEEAVNASVVAPNSVIELRRPNSGAPHRGSFFGKEVHVFSDATVLHVPASIDFICPSGDFDGDGVLSCSDTCWRDPAKTSEGVCGCGTADDDTDGDGVFDCDDDCPLDEEVTTRGMCGCPSDPDVAPEGTPCNDGVVAGTFTCNGAGACGDPTGTTIAPEPGCELKTIGSTGYFICPGGGGGGPTRPANPGDPTGAAALCAKTPGGRLVQIDSQKKNAEVASMVDGLAWIGAADFTTEGDWYWRGKDGAEKTQFWFGGNDGRPAKGQFTSWASKTPETDETKNCATIDESGQWHATNCSELHAYVCEFSFKRIGTGYFFPDPKGPAEIIPGWVFNLDFDFPFGYPVFEPGTPPECDVDYSSDVWTFRQEGYDSSKTCEEECGAGADLTDEEKEQCEAEFCSGSASVPDEEDTCSDDREPLRELDVLEPGTCEVLDLADLKDESGDPLPEDQQIAALRAAQDCSDVTFTIAPLVEMPTRCGQQTVCLDLDVDGLPQRCGEPGMPACSTGECGCPQGGDCLDDEGNPQPKFCLDSSIANACQSQVNHDDSDITQGPTIDRVDANNVCAGKCFSRVGCGYNVEDIPAFLNPEEEPARCDETQICEGPTFVDDLVAATFTEPEEPVIGEEEPEEEEDDPPYPTDFVEDPCSERNIPETCKNICINEDPSQGCGRFDDRHPWCTNLTQTEGDVVSTFEDKRVGQQGASGAPLKFTLEPISDMHFSVAAMPNGAAQFWTRAAAGVRAAIDFDLLGTSGSVEVVDLKAEISANVCRVTTKDSKLEVVGVDFLPHIASAAIFDSDEVLEGEGGATFSETCEAAVAAYVDAFDRAKKALRDAQTLLTQYKENEAQGQTFGPDFCEQVAGPGTRPRGMKGACPQEPHEVINNFIEYYEDQVAVLPQAVRDLGNAVLDGVELGLALPGAEPKSPYQFFVDLGVAEEESVTLVALQFFIGPIPCLLEISAYADYGIAGGFGAMLDPGRLIGGRGNFAQVGAEVGPYANSGITLFVGAGFNVGPLELSVGVEGGVTLGHITLPAVVSAGLNLERGPERNRVLPPDLVALTDTDQDPLQLFPTESALQKYSYKFNYEYGVGFQVTDILTGFLDGRMKVKFAFFSKKFKQRIATFDSNISVGPIMLIRGEGPGTLGDEDEIGGTQEYEGEIDKDVTYWNQALETVPFLQLARLRPPQSDLDQVATLDMTAVRAFFYDELCMPPVETGGECGRDADCETAGDVCVPNGTGVTVCGPPLCLPSGSACTVNSECCGGESCLLNLNGSRTCGQPGCTRAVGQSCLEPDEPTSACCAGSFVDCATSGGISGICVEIVR